MRLLAVTPADHEDVLGFLRRVDLTLAGIGEPGVWLWIERDSAGVIVGMTGYEVNAAGTDALIRSVAVDPTRREAGAGTRLARFAMDAARDAGARRAWLFSRRSGPFWQKLGFSSADRDALAAALPDAWQVRLFVETGQLQREVAWSAALSDTKT